MKYNQRKNKNVYIIVSLLVAHCLYTTLYCSNETWLDSIKPHFFKVTNTTTQQESLFCFLPSIEHKHIDTLNKEEAWESFHKVVFDFPHILEQSKKEEQVIIMLPKKHVGFTPVCFEAPWIEGSRVALAWASAYCRFPHLGSKDVRIIYFSSDSVLTERTVKQAIQQVMSATFNNDKTVSAEIQMQRRFFDFNVLGKEHVDNDLMLSEYTVNNTIEKQIPTSIQPHLEQPRDNQRRIVITGGAGFIGSHLTKELLKQGHQIIVLDNLLCSEITNLQEVEHNKHLAFFKIDVTRSFDIEGPVTDIIHLASAPSPMFYYTKPKETLLAGLQGTKNTLDLALKKGARYLFTSTSEVYGDPEVNPQPEDYPGRVSPIGKRSQYDQSKRGGETLIKLYFERYHLDARIVRIFNTYGSHMNINDGRVITNFIRSILHNTPITIYGNGLQTRSFAYVSDTVDGIIRVLNSESVGYMSTIDKRIFNIGNPDEFTIKKLATKMNILSQKYLGKPALITYIEQPDPEDPKMRRPNITRAFQTVGYKPIIALEEGLEKTFLYFLEKEKKAS